MVITLHDMRFFIVKTILHYRNKRNVPILYYWNKKKLQKILYSYYIAIASLKIQSQSRDEIKDVSQALKLTHHAAITHGKRFTGQHKVDIYRQTIRDVYGTIGERVCKNINMYTIVLSIGVCKV